MGINIFLGHLLEVKIKIFILKKKFYLKIYFISVATMTTVGYGDIGAKSPIEALYVSCALLISCGFFSYTFGLIGMLIKDLNEQDVEFTQEMRVLNRYFNEKKIPYEVQLEVR
jgi:hypothetical protein